MSTGYINLFNPPNINQEVYGIKHNLHDGIVQKFEEEFAEFVGAKYALALNSATNAIFLALHDEYYTKIKVPSILPTVVVNSVVNAGHDYEFEDNTKWVGGEYTLHDFGTHKIIDSAQAVSRNCFKKHSPNDLMIFSFYPTKPIGGVDGGMIVSDDEEKIKKLRCLAYNGVSNDSVGVPSWDAVQEGFGYKFYMSSLQAYFAYQSFQELEDKQDRIVEVWEQYDDGHSWYHLNTKKDEYMPGHYLQHSSHLFRITVKDWRVFIKEMHEKGVQCGKHYVPLHQKPLYKGGRKGEFPASDLDGEHSVSLPFHEGLTEEGVSHIIKSVEETNQLKYAEELQWDS